MHTCSECRDTGRVTETPHPIWSYRTRNTVSVTNYCNCHHGWKLKADEIRAAADLQDKHARDLESADDLMANGEWVFDHERNGEVWRRLRRQDGIAAQ
jgi:hypothetical protein